MHSQLEQQDIASLYMASFYCFVAKACARLPGAAASVERGRRERRTLHAGAEDELVEATRLWLYQSFKRMRIICSQVEQQYEVFERAHQWRR